MKINILTAWDLSHYNAGQPPHNLAAGSRVDYGRGTLRRFEAASMLDLMRSAES